MNNNVLSHSLSVHTQKGVGLIEVLVALFVLAIGVLGFAALQAKSQFASGQSIQKTQAANMISTFTEDIRVVTNTITTPANIVNTLKAYETALNSNIDSDPCATACTSQDNLIKKGAYDLQQAAKNRAMTVHLQNCADEIDTHYCLFVAWDKTDISSSGYGTDPKKSCMTEDGKSYWAASTCVMMEVM